MQVVASSERLAKKGVEIKVDEGRLYSALTHVGLKDCDIEEFRLAIDYGEFKRLRGFAPDFRAMPSFLKKRYINRFPQELSPSDNMCMVWYGSGFYNPGLEESKPLIKNEAGFMHSMIVAHEARHVYQNITQPRTFGSRLTEAATGAIRPKWLVPTAAQCVLFTDIMAGAEIDFRHEKIAMAAGIGVLALYKDHANYQRYVSHDTEVDARKYVHGCLQQADANPWIGVVEVNTDN